MAPALHFDTQEAASVAVNPNIAPAKGEANG
jgi:hypothetical protein